MISSGSTASRMFAACCISSASMPRRPAVSTMTMSRWARLAYSIASRATRRPDRRHRCPARARTPRHRPEYRGPAARLTAFGRCRSAATSIGWWPPLRRCSASLPASVVSPPWRPASMITVAAVSRGAAGGSRAEDVDQLFVNDLDDLLGRVERLRHLGADRRSLIDAMNARTTGSATSASRRASRISRAVASMSASVRRPCRAAS